MPRYSNGAPFESAKAKAACDLYLSMGVERSLAKVAEALGHPRNYKRTLEEWSSLYGWVERARKYDDEQLEKKRKQREKELEAMNERHAQIGVTQQKRALEQIDTLIKAQAFGSVAAVQLLKLAVDLERLARGAATEQLAVTGKDGGKIEMDVVVETFWGRGTDPRRKNEEVEETTGTAEQSDEDAEISVEFGSDETVEDDTFDNDKS